MAIGSWFEMADMPRQDENGDWYDLETGLYAKSSLNVKPKKTTPTIIKYTKRQKEIISIKAKDWTTLSQEEKKHLYSLIALENTKKSKKNT